MKELFLNHLKYLVNILGIVHEIVIFFLQDFLLLLM